MENEVFDTITIEITNNHQSSEIGSRIAVGAEIIVDFAMDEIHYVG